MKYLTLGRTGLKVSQMGIGAGGPSRLGQSENLRTRAESIDLVLSAFDAGVNFVDTAEAYGTEDIVGAAVAQRDRDRIVISTKKRLRQENISPEQLRAGLHESLRRLRSDYVDIYHLHGLRREQYEYYLQEIVPALQDLRREGKIRFIGVTESWSSDLQHRMLERALEDDVWDVIMVGFNLLNQTARQTVLPAAIERNIGVLVMFAVRRALSRPDKLTSTLRALIDSGELEPGAIDLENPLGFLMDDGSALSIPDAAYRFCRSEAGAHVILSGTGNPRHLAENLASFTRAPLPPEHQARLQEIFRYCASLTG